MGERGAVWESGGQLARVVHGFSTRPRPGPAKRDSSINPQAGFAKSSTLNTGQARMKDVREFHQSEPALMTAGELAAEMRISQRTLWRLLSAGKIIEPIRIGRSTRWQAIKVQRWIAAGCPSPTDFEE